MGKHTSLLDMYQVLGDAVEVLFFGSSSKRRFY